MARVNEGLHSFICHRTRLSTSGMNHTITPHDSCYVVSCSSRGDKYVVCFEPLDKYSRLRPCIPVWRDYTINQSVNF